MRKASEVFPDPEERKKVKDVLDMFHGSIVSIKEPGHVEKLVIKQHLWMRGGAVGISTRYVDNLEVEIMSKDKFGTRLYPNKYKISKEKLLAYPKENFSKGVPVRVVPIKDMEEIKMKAMLSQPMKGLTEEQIASARDKAIKYLEHIGYEVVNTLFTDEWYNKDKMKERGVVHTPICFLAKSLESMSQCDAVYFVKGWSDARGCKIEYEVAKRYGVTRIYEEDSK